MSLKIPHTDDLKKLLRHHQNGENKKAEKLALLIIQEF